MLERVRPFLPYLPWLSLATGIGGAVIMNRAPTRAWLVVVAAVGCWLLLFAMTLLGKRLEGSKRTRFALIFGSQIAMQTALSFPLPFYVKAASITFGHAGFFLVYAAVVVTALWDPLYAKAMARPWAAFLIHAFSVFIGLNMVLPVLGLSNQFSLYAAGALTAVGVPVVVLAMAPTRRWLALPAAAIVVVVARFSAPFVPPAPLELATVGIGSRVEARELVDPGATHSRDGDLVCHSAVKAPLGLKDALVHAWRRDRARLDEIALEVSGGRDAGFRTWSKKHPPPGGWPSGRYTCRVQTASGQVLGEASVHIGG